MPLYQGLKSCIIEQNILGKLLMMNR